MHKFHAPQLHNCESHGFHQNIQKLIDTQYKKGTLRIRS